LTWRQSNCSKNHAEVPADLSKLQGEQFSYQKIVNVL
jgi:hypothetical protein